MDNWMRLLGNHHAAARRRQPYRDLLVLFDIDGTILDMRHVILHVLRGIDRKLGTSHFSGVKTGDISFHEEQIDLFLDRLSIPVRERTRILSAYRTDFWSPVSVLEGHRPFRGVFRLIRWFQSQPRTFVGLNTGRPEALRFNTLTSLNNLGRAHGVRFRDDLLYMKPDHWTGDLWDVKVCGVEYFRSLGYHPIAMIDNEPENLEALALHKNGRGMLLLHADTISKSKLTLTTGTIIRGRSYNLDDLTDHYPLKRSA